jgi:5-methylcytosine-specific restriction endonuclease McrA
MDCGCLCGKPVQAVLDDYVKNYRGGWKNKKWKEQVKKQNGSICQKCGNDKNLIIHHIYSYKENWDRRHDVNNGVVLCQECHKKFHKSFGYRNNTEEQLVEFLSNL